jgi:hypothetical protein
MRPIILQGALLTIALLGAAAPAFAQPQFIPAKDVSAESKNGLFKVEAVALSKDHHEPFRWECRWHQKREGRFERTHAFEVTYPNGMDLQFRIAVSPSGNGFLLDCSTGPAMTFLDPTGRALRTYQVRTLEFPWGEFQSEDGHTLRLYTHIPLPQGMTTAGDLGLLETGRFFLPLGAPADDGLKKRALAFLAIPAEGTKPNGGTLEALIRDLDHQDPAVREQASRHLVGHGEAAAKHLESALVSPSAEVRSRVSRIREDILMNQLGYAAPERNVRLLAALLLYPDGEVATAASRRLRSMLPEAAVIAMGRDCSSDLIRAANWLQKRAEQLVWDPALGRCLWKE